MPDTREKQACIRFREREISALDAARQVTRESFSAFVRRCALDRARDLDWDTAQQRRDNAVIDAPSEGDA